MSGLKHVINMLVCVVRTFRMGQFAEVEKEGERWDEKLDMGWVEGWMMAENG